MTLRSPSPGTQWGRWCIAALVAACVYVVVFRLLYEGSLSDVIGAMQLRVLMPVLAVFGIFAYETRWDGVRREGKERVGGESRSRSVEATLVGSRVPTRPQSACNEAALNSDCGRLGTAAPTDLEASQTPQTSQKPLRGEAEYARARVMPHQPIPDCELDGKYLGLLVQSADLGYARAASKLGEYAMRRACMVEAYYWFSMAKKNGMGNLERTMQQIRSVWANGGFHRESANEYAYFPHERGSIGYALLCIASGHNVDAAKARLAASAGG